MDKIQILAEPVWSIACINSSIDQRTNTISLFSLVEQINVEKAAFEDKKKNPNKEVLAGLTFELVTLWRRVLSNNEKIKFTQAVEIIDPKKEIIGSKEFQVEIPEKINRTRFVIGFTNLPITVPGEYSLRVCYQGQKDKSINIPFEIVAR